MPSAVIFDLDGTLVDTLDDLTVAVNQALDLAALPHRRRDEIRRFVGDGARELVKRAIGDAAVDAEPLLAAFHRHYAAHLLDRTAPFPGVLPLLAELARRGTAMAVLSNKPDEATRRIVAALLPDVPFVAVQGERPDRPRKPDPATALELAATLGRPAAACLLVGDSTHDLETAHRAGMGAVAVAWGFRERGELLAGHPLALLERPDELLALLDPSPAG